VSDKTPRASQGTFTDSPNYLTNKGLTA
jgi:hypothetical protein